MRRLILGSKRFIRSATKQGFLRQLGHISLGVALVTTSILPATYASESTPLPFLHSLVQRYLPSLPSAITITPGLSFTITNPALFIVVDPGPDTIRYSCQWYKDDILQPELTGNTVNPVHTSLGEVWECVVTPVCSSADAPSPNDEDYLAGNTDKASSNPIAVNVTPHTPTTADNLVASITVSNPEVDNDTTFTYEWYRDDDTEPYVTAITTSTTNVLDSKDTSSGQIWKCVVTASDGTDEASASDEVTIGGDTPNTPPTAPAINVTPDSPNITNDLVCSITSPSSDPDGDTITYSYQWYKDDVLQDTLTSYTVDSSHTANGQVWRCLVTASDGIDTTPSNPGRVIIAHKATYYVDVNNGSDSNDGRSIDSPFQTIGRTANAVQPGDVVHIREGVYYLSSSLRLTTPGTSDNPIVFEAYPGEVVTLDGGMVYLDASWNTLISLEIRNSPQQGIYVFGNDNVFENIVTHDNYMSGLQIAEGDRNLLINVISHGNYGGEHTDGIGISSGYQNTLKGCVVYNNSDDGIDTWESSSNNIENCIAYSNGYNGGDGNGFKVGPGGSNIVTRCIAYNNQENGFDTNEGAGNDIYNNTAYNNGKYNFASYYYQNALRNNIAYSGGLLMADGPIQSHNTWNLDIYDPGFLDLDPSSPDFLSLSSNSAARDAGESGVDLGALQYGQTVADLIPAF